MQNLHMQFPIDSEFYWGGFDVSVIMKPHNDVVSHLIWPNSKKLLMVLIIIGDLCNPQWKFLTAIFWWHPVLINILYLCTGVLTPHSLNTSWYSLTKSVILFFRLSLIVSSKTSLYFSSYLYNSSLYIHTEYGFISIIGSFVLLRVFPRWLKIIIAIIAFIYCIFKT